MQFCNIYILNINIRFSFFLDQCLATIASVYWRSNEESVEGDKQPKSPVLEARETSSPGSRADRVQGSFNITLISEKNISLYFP